MRDVFRLDGRRAVVIGGAGGIGWSVAKGLAFYGAKTAIVGRNERSLLNARQSIEEDIGKTIYSFSADVCDGDALSSLIERVEKEMGGTDILVNAHGINIKKSAFDMTDDDWDKTFDVNVRSVMRCSLGFAAGMKERGWGRIITLSSVRAMGAAFGGGMALSYGSSKGAVTMLTKQLAAELAPFGITVNAVCPAATETEEGRKTEALIPGIRERMIAKIPLGRMAVPEDMIGAVVLLSSDAGAFITGTSLCVDGGMSAVC